MRGTITTQHTIWCAHELNPDVPFACKVRLCRSWVQVDGNVAVTKGEAMKQGWRYTRDFGWLCPPCAADHARWRISDRN